MALEYFDGILVTGLGGGDVLLIDLCREVICDGRLGQVKPDHF